jgi:hypothetical protein
MSTSSSDVPAPMRFSTGCGAQLDKSEWLREDLWGNWSLSSMGVRRNFCVGRGLDSVGMVELESRDRFRPSCEMDEDVDGLELAGTSPSISNISVKALEHSRRAY